MELLGESGIRGDADCAVALLAFFVYGSNKVCECVRQWVMSDAFRIDAVVFVTVAFLYTSSFLLLVLSATESRYYIIRASLCCVNGSLLLLSLLHRGKTNDK